MNIYPLHFIQSALLRRLLLIVHLPVAVSEIAFHAVAALFDKVRNFVVSLFNTAVDFVVALLHDTRTTLTNLYRHTVQFVVDAVEHVYSVTSHIVLDTLSVWRGVNSQSVPGSVVASPKVVASSPEGVTVQEPVKS